MVPRLRLVRLRGLVLPSGLIAILSFVLAAAVSVRSAQAPATPKPGEVLSSPTEVKNQSAPSTPGEKVDAKKSKLEMTKVDAAELSALADQLRDELKKMNSNVLSLDVIRKTEKLEKLARKIREEANGY